jgi:aminoglycoside/choline kinase family phosphotransferase
MTQIMSQASILVPELMAYDLDHGFIILSDFGDVWLLEQLKQGSQTQVFDWYSKAIEGLLQIQKVPVDTDLGYAVPLFDAKHINLELSYFSDWFLGKLLDLDLKSQQWDVLNQGYALLVQSALKEPQVLIHRDYHSRNLMVLADGRLGIIDYQDAMVGPLSYDLVSLLKDCYIVWPEEQRDAYLTHFYEKSDITHVSCADFKRDFEWMGLQRHLKVLGVFSRLNIRDNKPHYLDDMPRIMNYVTQVIRAYPEFAEFYDLWQQVIVPAFANYQATRDSVCVP